MKEYIDKDGKVTIFNQETGKEYHGWPIDAAEVMKFGGWGFEKPEKAQQGGAGHTIEDPLQAMTKEQLVELGSEKYDLTLSASAKKDDLILAILEAEEANA